MIDLCFQLLADLKDVDELLDKIRHTALTDYISLDGQTQPLQLINLAGYIQEYLTPKGLPASIAAGDILPLDKGFYKGIVFDIPGAEVNVGGEWIAFSQANESLIKSQDVFSLEWRLNGDLCRKLGYGLDGADTIKGRILFVDDGYNGLNIECGVSVSYSL